MHRCVLLLLIELSNIILFIRFAPKLASDDLKLKKNKIKSLYHKAGAKGLDTEYKKKQRRKYPKAL